MGIFHLLLGTLILFGFITPPVVSQAQERIRENGMIEGQQGVQKSNSAKIIAYDANEPPRSSTLWNVACGTVWNTMMERDVGISSRRMSRF